MTLTVDAITAWLDAEPLPEGAAEQLAPFSTPAPVGEPGARWPAFDADAAQLAALEAARQGHSFVLEGAPGTGKSQTLASLAIAAVARGHSVLLLARDPEALGALEASLEAAGLGAACLRLGAELPASPLKSPPRPARPLAPPEVLARYQASVEQLDAYADALHAPIGESEVTPYAAIAALCELECGEAPWPEANEAIALWLPADFQARLAAAQALDTAARGLGLPAARLLAYARRETHVETHELHRAIARARQATVALAAALAPFEHALPGAPRARDAASAARTLNSLARLAEPPPLDGLPLASPAWLERYEDLRWLITSSARLAELERGLVPLVTEEAWELPLLSTRLHLAAHGRKLLRALNADYRRASATVARLCVDGAPGGLDARLALLDGLMEATRHRALLRDMRDFASELFGPHWRGLDSDWPALERAVIWLHALGQDRASGRVDDALLAAFEAGLQAPPGLDALTAALVEHERAWRPVDELLALARPWSRLAFDEQLARLTSLEAQVGALPALPRFATTARQAEAVGLGAWLELAGRLGPAVDHAWHAALLARAIAERQALADFSVEAHEQAIASLVALAPTVQAHARAEAAWRHWEQAQDLQLAGPRELLALEAGRRLVPLLLAEPAAFARHLPPDAPPFDLLLVDDGAGGPTHLWLPGLAQARQLVVASLPNAPGLAARLRASGAGVHTLPHAHAPLPEAEVRRHELVACPPPRLDPRLIGLPRPDGLLEAVQAALQAAGLASDRQFGTAGCTLDLVVHDPYEPTRYRVAVLADGPGYRAWGHADARDRQAPRALEALGWQLVPLWSMAWHRDLSLTRERLVEAVKAAIGPEPERNPRPFAPPEPQASLSRPYQTAFITLALPPGGLTAVPTPTLALCVQEVVAAEGPVASAEVLARIAAASRLKRQNPSVATVVSAAIAHALAAGLIERRGAFLWPRGLASPPVRDRSGLPAARRKLGLIAPEERQQALLNAIEADPDLDAQSAAGAAAGLLGLLPPTHEVLLGLGQAVAELLEAGRIRQLGSHQLALADPRVRPQPSTR